VRLLRELGTPCLINQVSYSMFNRWVEKDALLDTADQAEIGLIFFSPLAQGLLTNRYLDGIPADSRAAKPSIFLKKDRITSEYLARARKLNDLAQRRGQSLAQMALAWVMRHPVSTSVLIGASTVAQVEDCAAMIDNLSFTQDELHAIEAVLAQ
jgi:L-glyceraldehyde 3-phosphate reductase